MRSNNIKNEIKCIYVNGLMLIIAIALAGIGIYMNESTLQTELNNINTSLNAKFNNSIAHSPLFQNQSTQDLIITINKGILRAHIEDKNYTCYDYLQDLTLFLDTNKTKWR